MTDAEKYAAVIAAEREGRPVLPGDLEAATAYAKRTKRRAPRAAAAELSPPEGDGCTPPPPPAKERPACSREGCAKPAAARGLCPAHYTAMRREDPDVRAKANAASKAYAERKRAAKATAEPEPVENPQPVDGEREAVA